MRVDARRLESGVAECLRDERDRRPIVDRMTCMGMPEPVCRSGLVHPCPVCYGLRISSRCAEFWYCDLTVDVLANAIADVFATQREAGFRRQRGGNVRRFLATAPLAEEIDVSPIGNGTYFGHRRAVTTRAHAAASRRHPEPDR